MPHRDVTVHILEPTAQKYMAPSHLSCLGLHFPLDCVYWASQTQSLPSPSSSCLCPRALVLMLPLHGGAFCPPLPAAMGHFLATSPASGSPTLDMMCFLLFRVLIHPSLLELFFLKKYLFGCSGSSLLHGLFSSCGEQGPL